MLMLMVMLLLTPREETRRRAEGRRDLEPQLRCYCRVQLLLRAHTRADRQVHRLLRLFNAGRSGLLALWGLRHRGVDVHVVCAARLLLAEKAVRRLHLSGRRLEPTDARTQRGVTVLFSALLSKKKL